MKDAGRSSAIIGITAGAIVVGWMVISPGWTGSWEPYSNRLHPFTTMHIGALRVIVVGILDRFLMNRKETIKKSL